MYDQYCWCPWSMISSLVGGLWIRDCISWRLDCEHNTSVVCVIVESTGRFPFHIGCFITCSSSFFVTLCKLRIFALLKIGWSMHFLLQFKESNRTLSSKP